MKKNMKKNRKYIKMIIAIIILGFNLLQKHIVHAATYKVEPYTDNVTTYVDVEQYLSFEVYKNGNWITSESEEFKKVKVISSNKKICKVSEDKKNIVGIREGKCNITIKYGDAKKVIHVTVKKEEITNTVVPVGFDTYISAQGKDWMDTEITYSVDDTKKAKIVNGYNIKGLKPGKVKLTITDSKGHSLSKEITILPELKLKIENYTTVKKKGKIVGFKLTIKNDSTSPVIFTRGLLGDYYGIAPIDLTKEVTIKAGERKTIAYYYEYADSFCGKDGKLSSECSFGGQIKYCGYGFSFWFQNDGKMEKGISTMD